MSKYAATRKAHNTQVAPSCHLASAFNMWWLYYHKAWIDPFQPCSEKDMRLIRPRVSPVVRTQPDAPAGVRRFKKLPQVPQKTRGPALLPQRAAI